MVKSYLPCALIVCGGGTTSATLVPRALVENLGNIDVIHLLRARRDSYYAQLRLGRRTTDSHCLRDCSMTRLSRPRSAQSATYLLKWIHTCQQQLLAPYHLAVLPATPSRAPGLSEDPMLGAYWREVPLVICTVDMWALQVRMR